MIADWSEPISTLPARVVQLTEAMNQKKYLDAQVLATDIAINMSEVTLWIGRELKGFVMKKYITLVFEYEADEELQVIRKIAMEENCRAWSMDHEMLRVDLMRQAIEDGDLGNANRYCTFDGVIALRDEIKK